MEGLLSGEYAGATALSNTVKFLSDLEVKCLYCEEDGNLYLKGRLRVSNARADRFLSIFVAGFEDGSLATGLAVPSDAEIFPTRVCIFCKGNTAA